ncbi:MAG: DNA replication/repair protein RecF [Porticoccaceae bacterium]|nr:DNA replication/repair protein RecF [Porticoccaceae bacterium]
MHISHLEVHQVRNLKHVLIDCHSLANVVYGVNGSGKTSFLEALHLLGRGKSFRHRDLRLVINHDADDLIVSGKVERQTPLRTHQLGVKRTRSGHFNARMDGESVQAAVQLAAIAPLQLIDAHSFDLLEGGPLQRRQFLDWGVFHVEPSYADLWRRFQKTLKQRNQLLRHGRIDEDSLRIWTAELIPLSEAITRYRQEYLVGLADHIEVVVDKFDGLGLLGVEYYRGWRDGCSLSDVMSGDVARDKLLGTTSHGAQKGDLKIKVDGVSASDSLSRGQTKLLVYALKLAQATYYRSKMGESCIFLLDDLPAELDHRHRRQVIDCLYDLDCQFFVTGVDRHDFDGLVRENAHKMFYVEHGVVVAS